MRGKIIIILVSIIAAVLFISGGYGLWQEELSISSYINIVRLDPPPPPPVLEEVEGEEKTAEEAAEVLEEGASDTEEVEPADICEQEKDTEEVNVIDGITLPESNATLKEEIDNGAGTENSN